MNNSTLPSTIDYKTLFQSLSAAYIVFDVDDPTFTIIEENQAHAHIAMVKQEDVIGKPLFEAFPDTSKTYLETGVSALQESIRRVISTGEPDAMPRLQYDIRDELGKYMTKYWSVTHYPVKDADGNVASVFQDTKDITPKVLTEIKLVEVQEKLDQAVENGLIGAWNWNVEQDKVYADEKLAQLFGVSAIDSKRGLPSALFLDFIHPDDRAHVDTELEAAITTKKVFDVEFRIVTAQGEVRWVISRGRAHYDESGNIADFPGIFIDITGRKATENNLNFLTMASTQFSASLDKNKTLNAIANMVVPQIADWCSIALFDGEKIDRVAIAHKNKSKVKLANELYALQGPPPLDAPSGMAKVIRTGEPECYPKITNEMLKAYAKSDRELELFCKLGFNSVIIVPMKLEGRVIGGITLVAAESKVTYKPSDIEIANSLANRAAMAVDNADLYHAAQHELKERKALQLKLEDANNVLESRVAERTSQLLDTNDGLEAEIRRRQAVEDELKEYGKDLARSNQELQNFAYVASHDLQEPLRKIQAFGDLLESEYKTALGDGAEYLARMRSAASRMSVLIQDLLAFSRVSTKEQVISRIDLNAILPGVVADLETCIKESKGEVIVEELPTVWAESTHMRQLFQNLIGNALKFHKVDTPPRVVVSSMPMTKKDKFYEIHVKDNGIGFDEKYLDRIFSVFQRLHGREDYEGTGIGLAVCRKIAERYGGSLEAKSTVGKGSTFIIKLPINQKEHPHDRT